MTVIAMKCNCGNENPHGSIFCSECGQKLSVTCSACGMTLASGVKFCSNCGNSLNSALQSKQTNDGNVIAGDVTGSYNTSTVNNYYNQAVESDEFCELCKERIPASAKKIFQCKRCGKFFCAKHMDVKTSACFSCESNESSEALEKYKNMIKMEMYDNALSYFKGEMEKPGSNPDIFFYAAIAILGGESPFYKSRSTIDTAIKYLNCAIASNPKGIYYYFLAYLKFDYYEKKLLLTAPNYRECLVSAYANGVSSKEISDFYALLGKSRPSAL